MIDTYSQAPTHTSTFGAGYGSASSFLSAEGFVNPSLSISDRLGIETEGITRGVSSIENMPNALDAAIPDSLQSQGMPVISVELIDDEVHGGNSYPHLVSEMVIPSLTNPLLPLPILCDQLELTTRRTTLRPYSLQPIRIILRRGTMSIFIITSRLLQRFQQSVPPL